jgi:FkbM family methyltransferase
MREWIKDITAVIARPDPVIVDGGANKGRIAEEFLAAFPKASLIAVEPIPALARKLRKRFAEANVRVIEAALGAAPGEAVLSVPQSRTLSSLLAPAAIRAKYPDRDFERAETVAVAVMRLDDIAPKGADILKLDLQGFELEALKGAKHILARIGLILTETAFTPLYDNQPLFPELEAFLTARGFRFARFYDAFTSEDGQTLSADALFLNESMYKE